MAEQKQQWKKKENKENKKIESEEKNTSDNGKSKHQ